MNDQAWIIKFVEEVEKREVIYNYKLPGYSRKDIIEKAWQEVAAEVKITAAECKEKWRNLRTVFTRKLKPPPSGSGRKKKAYYLADAKQLCVSFIKALAPPSSGNLPQIPQHETKYEIFENSERCYDVNDLLEDSSDMVQSSQASSPPTPPLIQAPSTFPPTYPERTVLPQPNRDKKSLNSRYKSAADADKCVAEYFKAKKAQIQSIEALECAWQRAQLALIDVRLSVCSLGRREGGGLSQHGQQRASNFGSVECGFCSGVYLGFIVDDSERVNWSWLGNNVLVNCLRISTQNSKLLIATPCEFGDQEDKLLRVQIILGVSSQSIKQHLLREDINLHKVVEYC
uniref:MADF domain-containing protein n=1 Tax=Timema poppense TaxID=170557 RepID=A0A7R9DPY2_TIMPO|nr:unnamed protein product [Timema poppensis]